MLTVKIFNDDHLEKEFQIILVGGGLKGLGGPTGEYDYKLIKPNNDLPAISHNPEEGELMLVVKALYQYATLTIENEQKPNNVISFNPEQWKEETEINTDE